MLDLTLPGAVQIVVQRQTNAGDTFRGGYALRVRPASGKVGDRRLEPRDLEQ